MLDAGVPVSQEVDDVVNIGLEAGIGLRSGSEPAGDDQHVDVLGWVVERVGWVDRLSDQWVGWFGVAGEGSCRNGLQAGADDG